MLLRSPLSIFFFAAYVLFCPFLNSQLEARWGLEKDANIEYLTDDTIYTVEKTGKWTMESEVQIKILNEAGRQALSVITLTYDATRSTLEVLGAKTTTNGKEYAVLKQKIEDKPLASDPLGLRNDHQILIPLEQVAVGSTIYLKLKEHIFKPDMDKYFNHPVSFAQGYLWKNVNVTFKSELPLLFKANDPKNSLAITQKKEGGYNILKVKLKKPLFQSLVAESEDAFLDPATETYVSVSTEQDYQRIGKHEGKQYNPILTAALPKAFEDIRNAASKIKNETECIDMIVSQLIKKVNYLGNWNSAEGHFIPRTLEAIVTTGYGDCKDYSVSLAAILNALGYKARVAVVYRGEVYVEGNRLPGLNQFNHAIVKAVSPSGKTYWIDPTNITTMADGIYPDIADRPAIVLDPENPIYERIPPIDYRHAKFSWEEATSIKDEGYVVTNGSICTQGESGKGYTEALTMHPHSVVKEFMAKDFCNSGDPINATLNLPELTSPKVQPLKVSYSYEEENTMLLTNHGYAFPLKSTWHKPYVATSQKHEGAIYVGHPETLVGKKFFKNVKAEDIKSLEFSLKTPWLNAKREIVASAEGVTVIETVEKLKSVISAKELKSPQFQTLRNTLRKYCDGVAIILSQPSVDQKVAQKK
jgi:hypothetical protein